MPERPDLEYVVPRLDEALRGRRITGARVEQPVVMRTLVRGDPGELLAGRSIGGVERRGHFVVFALDGEPALELAVHPMLAGRFSFEEAGRRTRGLAVAFTLDDGSELHFRDTKAMGKVYVMPPDQRASVPGLGTVGIDVLDPAVFTRERLAAIVRKRRDQLKVFLLDKGAVDSFGNAYADETCFAARLHPKAWVGKLTEEELDRLHGAMVKVLTDARAEVERRQAPLDEKVRDFLSVRNRKGEACPVCGDRIRTCGVQGHDAFFCPTCQPDGRGSSLVNWRKA